MRGRKELLLSARSEGDARESTRSGGLKPDHEAIKQVATRIEIADVELIDLHFERVDNGANATTLPSDLSPTALGVAVNEWKFSEDGDSFACVISFRTFFHEAESGEEVEESEEPYTVISSFRLKYTVRSKPEGGFSDYQMEQFINWNGVFNVWPYWRELLTNIIERAQLPRYIVPVLGLPGSPSSTDDQEP